MSEWAYSSAKLGPCPPAAQLTKRKCQRPCSSWRMAAQSGLSGRTRPADDLGGPVLSQLALARLIGSGDLERHVRLVRGRLRKRRDAVLQELALRLPQARLQGIAAGLHLLITLPDAPGALDDVELTRRIRERDVIVHPLSLHRQLGGPPGFVLAYAAPSGRPAA